MPFLRDEGPPIPPASIQKYRESLPVEYGWQVVNETGREVLVVRVPKAKPDYLHDLSEVAFYVGLESIRNTKDVLLIGHEKTARLEPQLLRDHVRAQAREDGTVVDHLRRSLDRQYGHTFVRSPSNHQHNAFAVRIPKETVAQFTPDDVNAIRQLVASLRARVLDCQYAYVVSNTDHERLGRRVLLELIGDVAGPSVEAAAGAGSAPLAAAPASASPSGSTAPPALAPTVAASPARHTPFPSAAPSISPAPIAPAPPAPAPVAQPSLFAPPATIAAPSPPPTMLAPAEVAVHEEYEIVSKPKPAAAPAPPPSPPIAPAQEHEEYEIVSKPRAPAAAPVAAAEPESAPEPEKTIVHADKEFEVFVSKPRPRAEPAPSITPPGKAGFQAALGGATGPAPAKTKEYEIIGRTSVTSDPTIASRLRLPGTAPAAAPSPFTAPAPAAAVPMQAAAAPIPPRVATPMQAPADNGASIIARIAPAAPELVLAQRFRDAGYEVVEGLRAQGTAFAFAAHKPNGRRVLVKRSESFAAEDAASLAQLVAALGADVALVVADDIKPGTRLATWGTRIEVVAPADVGALAF